MELLLVVVTFWSGRESSDLTFYVGESCGRRNGSCLETEVHNKSSINFKPPRTQPLSPIIHIIHHCCAPIVFHCTSNNYIGCFSAEETSQNRTTKKENEIRENRTSYNE